MSREQQYWYAMEIAPPTKMQQVRYTTTTTTTTTSNDNSSTTTTHTHSNNNYRSSARSSSTGTPWRFRHRPRCSRCENTTTTTIASAAPSTTTTTRVNPSVRVVCHCLCEGERGRLLQDGQYCIRAPIRSCYTLHSQLGGVKVSTDGLTRGHTHTTKTRSHTDKDNEWNVYRVNPVCDLFLYFVDLFTAGRCEGERVWLLQDRQLCIPSELLFTDDILCIHRRCIYKGDTSTHAQGTDSRVAFIHSWAV